MSFTTQQPEPCTICGSNAIIHHKSFGVGTIVDCSRCGNFEVDFETVHQLDELPYKDPKRSALASHVIQKMQAPNARPLLPMDFFTSLADRSLPTPAEAMDNLLLWIAERASGRPGTHILINYRPMLLGRIGVVDWNDIEWLLTSLKARGDFSDLTSDDRARLSPDGWARVEELKRAHISSSYAFFARQFNNPDLDQAFAECLRQAVQQTGYELRTVTQRAGLVDAVIEDEIRRCRFLIADLSDDNAGAYWEAGFAEGLGKPVIYICRKKDSDGARKTTHFDANHRHTVRWDLETLDDTATQLKAVIRNTLLGDAKQTD